MSKDKAVPPRIEVSEVAQTGYSNDYGNDYGFDSSPVSLDSGKKTFTDSRQKLEEAQMLLQDAAGPKKMDFSSLMPFSLNPDQMMTLVDPKNPWVLVAMGGLKGLERILVTNSRTGLVEAQLTDTEVESREETYGKNVVREKKQKGLLQIMIMTLNDKVLIILIVAALISLALGLYETFGEGPEYDDEGRPLPKVDWVEGVAILVAVAIVTIVGSVNDWQKEQQFAKLNRKREDRTIEVVRNGQEQQVNIHAVQVGDLVRVQPGDILAVDGIVVQSDDLQCDESSVTGESDTMRKTSAWVVVDGLEHPNGKLALSEKDTDCLMISGSRVMQGSGSYIATGVGENSMYGRTMLSLQDGDEVTPLQEKLNRIADGIAHFGVWSALALFTVLFIRFLVQITQGRDKDLPSSQKGNEFMDIFIVAVTIVVVAVPEGLPLAVTLALAFATTRMVKDNCLVRVLKSCETMGGATAVCSDKTGTLTQNKMTVVAATVGLDVWNCEANNIVDSNLQTSKEEIQKRDEHTNTRGSLHITGKHGTRIRHSSPQMQASDASPDSQQSVVRASSPGEKELLCDSIVLNSSVYEDYEDPRTLIGSKTESALVGYARDHLGLSTGSLSEYRDSRPIEHTIPFDSARKYMATIIRHRAGYRLYIKGAAEILLKSSTHVYAGANKAKEPIESFKAFLEEQTDSYANRALRPIAIAFKDFETEHAVSEVDPGKVDISGLTFLALFGIQDPLRPGVREAVEQCHRAGVVVRMVTGDNIHTARAIAVNAAILEADDRDSIVMEGPKFRTLNDNELLAVVPKLRVLARSSPQDKRRLVEFLKANGETVAVTGDGTNDAPALKLADVGFSMGITGTEVAKEASDIIIMDDNFSSIVNAMKWGRTVNDAVKKFLQFQLTVNVTAVALTFVSAVASSNNKSVLTAVQLLWVNLIMDTLAALALATDAPSDEVLDRPPDNRKKSLITITMWKMIFGQALYQLAVTFVLHFAGSKLFYGGRRTNSEETMRLSAMVFNAFVWMQFFNMFVNRRLDNKQNLLVGITHNIFFPLVVIAIGGFQILIMFVGGAAFSIKPSTGAMWATSLICGFVSIPAGMLLRLVPDRWVMALYPRKAVSWSLKLLESVQSALSWCFSPITWVVHFFTAGCVWLFYKVSGKLPPAHNNLEAGADIDYDEINPFEYTWMPGIEKSIDDLAMIRRVRGGRLNQLTFNTATENARATRIRRLRERERQQREHELHSHHLHVERLNPHSRSRSTSASSLTALMAPAVLGGAIGGWSPMKVSSD